MQADNEMANLTPSGEILSIGPQPSRAAVPMVTEPTLLVLAENDLLFPIADAQNELSLFASSTDKELYVVPGAGHSFMLHRNAPETNAAVADFLAERSDVFPACPGS